MATHETAEAIIFAAIPLFAQRGFGGVSTREICTAAGVSGNGLHYHFGSKQALYQAILDRHSQPHLATVRRLTRQRCRDVPDLQARVRLLAEEIIDEQLEDPDLLRIAFGEFERGELGPRFAEESAAMLRALGQFFAREQKAGLLRTDMDVEILAGTFLERVYNQVRHIDRLEALYATTVRDEKYRDHWLSQLIDLLFLGATPRSPKTNSKKKPKTNSRTRANRTRGRASQTKRG